MVWKYDVGSERSFELTSDKEDGADENYFIWEEYDYSSNSLYYEYDLEDLENQPKREKTNVHKTSLSLRNLQS